MEQKANVAEIKAAIRNIPNFPSPGVQFKDITPVLGNSRLFASTIDLLTEGFQPGSIDTIVGIDARGFIFAAAAAFKLKAAFVPVRKKGKLPFKTYTYEYNLEYGSAIMEIHIDSLAKGSQVLIHDDLLATGGTAAAAAELVKMQGGNVTGFAFLVGLDFLNGKDKLIPHSKDILTLVNY